MATTTSPWAPPARSTTCSSPIALFGSGHGVSIGSGARDGVSNLVVANCSFTGGTFGLRLKADTDRGGLVRNLSYHDITMTNVQMPVLIYSHYRTAGSEPARSAA
jgi:polygalacturonase